MNSTLVPVDDDGAALYARILERIRTAPHEVPSVRALAGLGGVSVSQLTDLCRAHAHLTPVALLGRERVRAAQSRLLHSRESVVDVGRMVGFEREATFHRQFLAMTGTTPSAWRALPVSDAFSLRVPADFRADIVTRYFARDDRQVAERVDGSTVSNGIATEAGPAVLTITLRSGERTAQSAVNAGHRLSADDMALAHATAVRMLRLGSSAPAFEARAGREPLVARLVFRRACAASVRGRPITR